MRLTTCHRVESYRRSRGCACSSIQPDSEEVVRLYASLLMDLFNCFTAREWNSDTVSSISYPCFAPPPAGSVLLFVLRSHPSLRRTFPNRTQTAPDPISTIDCFLHEWLDCLTATNGSMEHALIPARFSAGSFYYDVDPSLKQSLHTRSRGARGHATLPSRRLDSPVHSVRFTIPLDTFIGNFIDQGMIRCFCHIRAIELHRDP